MKKWNSFVVCLSIFSSTIGTALFGQVEYSEIQAMLEKVNKVSKGHPRIYFRDSDSGLLKNKMLKVEQKAILHQLDLLLQRSPDPVFVGSYAAAYFFKNSLEPHKPWVDSAIKFVNYTLNDRFLFQVPDANYHGENPIRLWNSSYKAIYQAPNLFALALAYDLGYAYIPDTLRKEMAGRINQKAIQLITGQTLGFNSNAWSNWQGIVNGAAGVAFLATKDDTDSLDFSNHWLDSALVRMVRHLGYLGDLSHSSEGFENLRLEMCSGVLPLALAYKNITGSDLPGSIKLSRLAEMYSLVSVKADSLVLSATFGGEGNYWNTNQKCSGDWVMSFGLANSGSLSVAKGGFDQIFGLQGDKTFNLFKPHDAIFAFLYYPDNEINLKPGNGPYFFEDHKAGFFLFRSTIGTSNDIVFSAHANLLAKPKSHSYRDAGSFRLIANGKIIVGRGSQSTSKKEDSGLENAIRLIGSNNCNPARVVKYESDHSSKLLLRLNMDPVYQGGDMVGEQKNIGVYDAKRIFDLNYTPGLQLVVRIMDSLQGPAAHCWRVHTGWQSWFSNSKNFTVMEGGKPAFEARAFEMCNPKEGVYQVIFKVDDE